MQKTKVWKIFHLNSTSSRFSHWAPEYGEFIWATLRHHLFRIWTVKWQRFLFLLCLIHADWYKLLSVDFICLDTDFKSRYYIKQFWCLQNTIHFIGNKIYRNRDLLKIATFCNILERKSYITDTWYISTKYWVSHSGLREFVHRVWQRLCKIKLHAPDSG